MPTFLDHVLEPPRYGWQDNQNQLVKPTVKQSLSEFVYRLNPVRSRKNWITFTSWLQLACLLPFLLVFLFRYMSVGLFITGFLYSMVLMGVHGTVWYHRYCTHGAFTFKNKFWRFVTQNLVIKTVFEETYVISHHVHHAKSDQPGDPYNAQGGFWYCFLADANHQPINRNLDEADYQRILKLMAHTGVHPNSYAAYQRWGSVASPSRTILHWLLNWAFWGAVFFLIGGWALVTALFGAAFVWTLGVRTFNYEGHGKGKNKQKEGIDFDRKDQSINQIWPGYVAGEWHNNHHLFPTSARSGFLSYQLDLAWCYIWMLSKIGGVSKYYDAKPKFLEKFYLPYLSKKQAVKKSQISSINSN